MLRDQRESRSSGLQVAEEETTKKQNKTRTVKRGITNWTTTIYGHVFLTGAIAKQDQKKQQQQQQMVTVIEKKSGCGCSTCYCNCYCFCCVVIVNKGHNNLCTTTSDMVQMEMMGLQFASSSEHPVDPCKRDG